MKLNPLVLMRKEFDDTGIVFDPENNKAMSLNTVGVVIWEALDKGLSESEIVEAITGKFAVSPETASKDLAVFLDTLKSRRSNWRISWDTMKTLSGGRSGRDCWPIFCSDSFHGRIAGGIPSADFIR